jgi:ATP-dependent DNA ligase
MLPAQDVRPEPLEQRRKRLAGRLLSEALRITVDGGRFRHACWMNFETIVSKRIGSRYVSGRTRAWRKTKNLNLEWANLMIANSEVDRLLAELGMHPSLEGELRET